MKESYNQILSRFKTAIENKDDMFIIFNEDKENSNENCYYLNIDYWEEYVEFKLDDINEKQIASYDYSKSLISGYPQFADSLLTILLQTINLDLQQRELDVNIEIRRNKELLEFALK